MRLDKYLSYALNLTRSDTIFFMKKNDIYVNDKIVKKKDFKIDENIDVVKVNGEIVEYRRFVYYMLNKPSGLVCSKKGFTNNTIYDLFKDIKYDVSSIGRLDKDTEGLLIITNDGALNHFITSPNNHVDKKYYVEIDNPLTNVQMEEFEKGILIKDGDMEDFVTRNAKIEKIDELKYYVTISEGKFHQIKRMFKYFDKDVLYLKRVQMGKIILDESLKEGEYRPLTKEEIEILKNEYNKE